VKRVLTALILVPIAVALVLAAPAPVFALAVAALACASYREFERLTAAHGIPKPGLLGYGAGLAILFVPAEHRSLLALIAPLALAWAMRERPLAGALPRASALVLGTLWIFGAWRCGLELRSVDPRWLLFVLVLNWVGDTAAYYAGRAFGSRKLAPEISPAKTWEGAVASILAALASGWLYARAVWPGMEPASVLVVAAVCNVTAQLGDLGESAIKRGAGVKDSGSILPGHGGWLDRTDGLLFSMPAVYVALHWVVSH
jgi:phosphatidate cytidylyltransferase